MQPRGQDSAGLLLTERRVATLARNRRADERDIRHKVIRAAGGKRWKTRQRKHHLLLLYAPLPFARGHACFHLDISVNELARHLAPAEASVFVWKGEAGKAGSGQERPSPLVCSSLFVHAREGAAGGNDRERCS